MLDRQHTQSIFENKPLNISPMAYVSLDQFHDGATISLATDDKTLIDHQVSCYAQALERAEDLYRSVRFAGQISRFLSWLFHQPAHLMDVSEIVPDENVPYHLSGWKYVPISRISVSETCNHDFDFAFNPLNDQNRTRWINIAALYFLGVELPPVDLLQVDNTYIVRDGHYRISAARALGQDNIDACVTKLHYPSKKPLGNRSN